MSDTRCEACEEIFDVARYGAPDDVGMDDDRDPEHTCALRQPEPPSLLRSGVVGDEEPEEFCTGACDHDNDVHVPFFRSPSERSAAVSAAVGEDRPQHVKTTPVDDGGCQRCDECDLRPGHDGPCDCDHPADAVTPLASTPKVGEDQPDPLDVEPSWTDRFADDVSAALIGEHRPRWVNGKPCREHATDDCCYDCCTSCSLLDTLAESGYDVTPGGWELVRTDDLDALISAATNIAPWTRRATLHDAAAAVVEGRTEREQK